MQPIKHLSVLLIAFLFSTNAMAATVNYSFYLDTPDGYPVTNLLLYAADASQDHAFLAPDVLSPSGTFQLNHIVPFDPIDALVVGITERDKDDKWDIIMFTNHAFAASAFGFRFDALFPTDRNIGHNEVPLLLQAAHTGDTDALNTLTGFIRGADVAAAYFDPVGPYSIIKYSMVGDPIGANTAPLPAAAWAGLIGFGMLSGYSARRKKKLTQTS